MKIRKFLLCTGMALGSICAATAQGLGNSYSEISSGTVVGMSSDGNYVVGYATGWGDEAQLKSYIYNVADKTMEWKTEYDAADYDKSGQFAAVTSGGIIAGSMKNKDMQLESSSGGYFAPGRKGTAADGDDDVVYTPIMTAAVWKDGKVFKLGTGTHELTEFTDGTDGSYASGISDDGMFVVGYIQKSWMAMNPCAWALNEDQTAYEYIELSLPDEAGRGSVKGISADGSVAFGEVSLNGNKCPVIWRGLGNPELLTFGAGTYDAGSEADAASPNGQYILLHGNSYTSTPTLTIYDCQAGTYTDIPLPSPNNTYECKGLAIDNNGNAFVSIADYTDYTAYTYYFSMANNALADIDSWLATVAPEELGQPSLKSATVAAMSADGLVMCGNTVSSYGSVGNGWVLTLEGNETVMINAPQITDLFFNSIDQITVKWKALTDVPEGVTITGYRVCVDGEMQPDVAAAEAESDGTMRLSVGVNAGTHEAYVMAVGTSNGKEVVSTASSTLSTSVSSETSLFLFDNFDDATFDQNGNPIAANDNWTALKAYGNESEIINWSLESSNFENNTPYMTTVSISGQPWSSTLTSRFLDATEAKDFFLSFYATCILVNSSNQNLSTDYLDVEYSTDGENWNTISSFNAAELKTYAWNFYTVEMPAELEGKTFRLRFNAHGNGMATLKWNVDCVGINDKLTGETPTGLKVSEGENGKAELTWHNSIGTYEVSYLGNSNILTDYCTGSEGTPLIVAIDPTPEMMVPYAGSYIHSVSAFLYDNPSIVTDKPTKAEAIVYADGEVASRGTFTGTFDTPYSSTIQLETPVKIESGKQYRIAVRIFDYDASQTPVYYQSTDDFIAGKTDLYSEDEGQTWNKLSDVYTSDDELPLGKCIWPIRANISSEVVTDEVKTLDSELLAYNVYRNGEKLNEGAVYAHAQRFTDETATDGAAYSIQAFYKDGRISPLSEPVTFTETAIGSVAATEGTPAAYSVTGNAIEFTAAPDKAELFNLNGRRVASTRGNSLSTAGLPTGTYLLQVTNGRLTEVHKVIVGR